MTARSLDLTHLRRRCLFHSDTPVDSHDLVARELADHSLRWRNGPVDTTMYKADISQLKLFALRYGAEVDITPRPTQDFVLVHLSLRGTAEVVCDGERMVLSEGRTGWMAPRKSWRMRWQTGSEQLILKVPNHMLQVPGATRESRLAPAGMLPQAFDAQWRSLMQALLDTASTQRDGPAQTAWVAHYEQVVAMFLLAHGMGMDAVDDSNGPADDVPVGAGAVRRLDAMEQYMRQCLGVPIVLADLAQAAGISSRALQQLCHRHRGASPMDLLRNMRLDAARAKLLQQGSGNVTHTALEFGFGHLGRFSTYYRERFGELPRETCERRH
jgi:AraC-like DNA-binding protein